ncbi:hypothetical protein FH972_012659 [Carpinus fangiana]|uniref:Uncharacterized protein n=1 Tax=Carpinus fangiana TaxID=176857 RepID=A0A5N6R5D5_9ROSI|nr:hypothetical protein FH972_012659 [Carpinus fangiana]
MSAAQQREGESGSNIGSEWRAERVASGRELTSNIYIGSEKQNQSKREIHTGCNIGGREKERQSAMSAAQQREGESGSNIGSERRAERVASGRE